MTSADRIRGLIEEGKIGQEEGLELLAAFASAEARDRVVGEEIRHLRSRRRRPSRWSTLIAGLAIAALAVLLYSALVPTRATTPETTLTDLADELKGQDLDPLIERLETRLRQPGASEDYRLLGLAYQMRFARTGDENDRDRAAQALARADRIERRTAMRGNPATFGVLFVLVIVAAVAVWIMLMYNGLAQRDERVNERWAQVETVLQRRLDLIPPLVQAVQAYAAHERETLLEVTEARARVMGILQGTGGDAPRSSQAVQDLTEAEDGLSGAIGRLLALAEAYPDLKASTNFVTLQDQLEGTENRISVERQRYNDAVRQYNSRLRIFPHNVVGGMFGYEPREYFESSLGAEEPVDLGLMEDEA
jgi:LemA protein